MINNQTNITHIKLCVIFQTSKFVMIFFRNLGLRKNIQFKLKKMDCSSREIFVPKTEQDLQIFFT